MAREIDAGGDLYYLPRRDWWVPDPDRDTSFQHFGRSLATAAGPASGPHTQLAQNLLLSWLGGGRFMELKTVQVNDELVIPRPCIDVPHVGYNVEWSQELRVPQSAREYAKGWMLIHMLASEHGPGLWAGPQMMFDISVGYDLDGIRTQKVRNYLESMRDGGELLRELRDELPPSLAKWAAVPCPDRISDSITISTFHGCPAEEIEAIATQCLEWGFHTVVKLNPTLLGHKRTRSLLDRMGYDFIELNPEDFERDLQWSQLMEMVPRLEALAEQSSLGFGVKFTNTLVSKSPEPPFGEGEMYLSGPPLHVLSFLLAAEFRAATHPNIPITFSAGVDAKNFSEAIASGLGPVTSCSDLLKGRGYARMTRYLRNLEKVMAQAGVSSLNDYLTASGGASDPKLAASHSLSRRAKALPDDPRYSRLKNQKPPNKIGSALDLLDCITCDKCIPVCPNAANFRVMLPVGNHQPGLLVWDDTSFRLEAGDELVVAQKHQIGNTADACNLCGQCDVWCPEDGGPYIVKPTLFLSEESFSDHPGRDGFLVEETSRAISWRRGTDLYRYSIRDDGRAELDVGTGTAILDGEVPVETRGAGEVDLGVAVTMRLYLEALCRPDAEVWLPPR